MSKMTINKWNVAPKEIRHATLDAAQSRDRGQICIGLCYASLPWNDNNNEGVYADPSK